MATLNDIVNINITRETLANVQVNFGVSAFLTNDASGITRRLVQYSSLTDVQAAFQALTVGQNTLDFATAYFGQPRQPESLYVIRNVETRAGAAEITFTDTTQTAADITGAIMYQVNGGDMQTVPFDTDGPTTWANFASELGKDNVRDGITEAGVTATDDTRIDIATEGPNLLKSISVMSDGIDGFNFAVTLESDVDDQSGSYIFEKAGSFVANGLDYTIQTQAGLVGPITVPFNTDDATTWADVASSIQSQAGVTTAVVGTNPDQIEIVTDPGFLIVTINGTSVDPLTFTFQVLSDSYDRSLADALDDAVLQDNGWYAISIYNHMNSDIQEVAAWAQTNSATNGKLFLTASNQATIFDGTDDTDLQSTLSGLDSFRTAILSYKPTELVGAPYPEGAWAGNRLVFNPGSQTWALKSLAGIPTDDITQSESSGARSKGANVYVEVAQVGVTLNGTVAAQTTEYIDVIRGIDWLKATMQIDLFNLLINNAKIPYNEVGIAQIQAVVDNRLTIAVQQGVLSADPAPVSTVPSIDSIPKQDKADRILRNVKFQGTLAGAIQALVVEGTVSV